MIPNELNDEQYIRNTIKNNILKFLIFNENDYKLEDKYKLNTIKLKYIGNTLCKKVLFKN